MDVPHLVGLSDALVLRDAGLIKSKASLVRFTGPSSVICPSKKKKVFFFLFVVHPVSWYTARAIIA